MRTGWLLAVATGSLALTGCMESFPDRGRPDRPRPERPRPPEAGACNAGPAQFAVGRQANPRVVARALRASGARVERIIHPGQAVTMEFRADRLNLEVDGRNRVRAVRCG